MGNARNAFEMEAQEADLKAQRIEDKKTQKQEITALIDFAKQVGNKAFGFGKAGSFSLSRFYNRKRGSNGETSYGANFKITGAVPKRWNSLSVHVSNDIKDNSWMFSSPDEARLFERISFSAITDEKHAARVIRDFMVFNAKTESQREIIMNAFQELYPDMVDVWEPDDYRIPTKGFW